MKALFLFNPSSGKKNKNKKINKIIPSLKAKYDVFDFVITKSKEDFMKRTSDSCGVYDVLYFAGGDGTFNMVINALGEKENPPILAAFPTGTVNDMSKNFGLKKNIKKNYKIIEKNHIKSFDVIKANDTYFGYTAAIGTFSDIPYSTKIKRKGVFGPLAYYFKALPRIFKTNKITCTYKDKDGEKTFKCAFLIILNSTHIGGFKINKHSDNNDGLVDVMYTDGGLFNGLLRYILRKRKVQIIKGSEFKITTNSKDCWDYDGEKGDNGDVSFKVLHSHLKIYSK